MAYAYLHDLIRHWFGFEVYLPIPMFGLVFTTSCIIAGLIFKREARRIEDAGLAPIPTKGPRLSDQVIEASAVVITSGVVGGRVFHILEHPTQFLNDPLAMIFTRSGLSVMGGWIFGAVACALFVRRYRFPIGRALDSLALGLIIGYAFGRWACQISGDGDWGIVANMALKPDWLPQWFWAQTYTGNVLGRVIEAPGVYPTPIYESIGAFMIFAVMWKVRKHRFGAGWLFALYMVLSGFERFWIEKIRPNPIYSGVGLSQAEIISIIFMTCGAVAMIYLMRRRPAELAV